MQLKNCPCCDAESLIGHIGGASSGWDYIYCSKCLLSLGLHKPDHKSLSLTELGEQWNTRVEVE